jgi:hypothetical protein
MGILVIFDLGENGTQTLYGVTWIGGGFITEEERKLFITEEEEVTVRGDSKSGISGLYRRMPDLIEKVEFGRLCRKTIVYRKDLNNQTSKD